jgi:electron transfer flavoprotein-quinone oxidoreductase
VAVGIVVSVSGLGQAGVRPEELIVDLKEHPAVAPLVRGGTLLEYSAHLIPEGGSEMGVGLAGDGLLVAGDAAGMCLAAGLWLEGVNFAIGAGAAAGEVAAAAARAGDASSAFLDRYRRRLESTFVLSDLRKLRGAPHLILSERVQRRYPALACNLVESLFTVTNPAAKAGVGHLLRREARRAGVRLRELARDGWSAWRTFG